MSSESFPKTNRNKVKRIPRKAKYDKESIYNVLDEGLVCHVGFSTDDGPVVIPMVYGRDNDILYLHGSIASRLTKTNRNSAQICCTVTLLDSLIIARSLFHHSMGYRSVVIFGTADEVTEENERDHGFRIITNHTIPNRWDDARPPNAIELKSTRLLRVTIESATLKQGDDEPGDDKKDIEENKYWAGTIPIQTIYGEPIPDPNKTPKVKCPDNLVNYSRNLKE